MELRNINREIEKKEKKKRVNDKFRAFILWILSHIHANISQTNTKHADIPKVMI